MTKHERWSRLSAKCDHLALLFLVLLYTAPTRAQDIPEPPSLPPGDDVITALSEGARAPHGGMLLDTDTAIRWTNRLSWWQETYRLHVAEDVEVLAAIRASHATELELVQASYLREITGLREDLRAAVVRYESELARYRSPPFYETWGFAFGVGVLVSGIVVALVGGLAAGL